MSHKANEGYSAKNPVPKVALRSLIDPHHATETKAKSLTEDPQQQKDEMRDHQNIQKMEKGVEVEVKDPVTGEETTVKHASEEVDPKTKGENVLGFDLPSPDWSAYQRNAITRLELALKKIILAYATIPLVIYALPIPLVSSALSNHVHIYNLLRFAIALLPPTAFAYTMLFSVRNQTKEEWEDRLAHSERERGLAAGTDTDGDGKVTTEERTRESAEWVNAMLRGLWPIINPDLFSSAVDMLEDIMQASVPQFVHSVRVADLDQGSNAMRLTSIRSLPDVEVNDVMKGVDDGAKARLNRDHINVEMSFVYRALPSGTDVQSKAQNSHLLIEFFLGLRGVWNFRLPVWVELTGVAGTARARMELIPDPPFVKTTLVTLMGLPKISIAVTPMTRKLPNMMNLPIISGFISKSIDAACAEYVAPKSLTLDLQQLISGDDIKKDTESIGVVVLHIHRAVGIKSMDTISASDPTDPYVTVTYSRQGKPLYSTRIIKGDLNPVFEETAVITVDANAIRIGERISLQLWDSDRRSADDMMGFVEIDLLDIIRHKGEASRHSVPLESPDSEKRPGAIEYTVGYYAKRVPNSALATDGSDPAIPEDLRNEPEFKEARAIALNDLEAAVLTTPPDRDWPSGILSVQVHEIRELSVRTDGQETTGHAREGEKGQDEDAEEQEEGDGLPSSYCTIALNDDMIYSTRVKPISSSPIFNAGAEHFIRDWRTTHVSVVVRDSRMRENDPVLGMVFLKLSELFINASVVTRFFPLEHGIGYGSIRISVLFRPVSAKLPPNLLGFDTGTLKVRNVTLKVEQNEATNMLKKCELRLKTSASSDKVSRKQADVTQGGGIVWHMEESPSSLPVRKRYSSALIIGFKDTSGLMKTGKNAMAVLWLRDLIDSHDGEVEIALWKANDFKRLKQNYIPSDGNLDEWKQDAEKYKRIGTLVLDIVFEPGVSREHKQVLDTSDPAKRRIWDEVDRRTTAGLDQKVGEHEDGEIAEVNGANTEVESDKTHVEHHEGVEGTGSQSESDDDTWVDGHEEHDGDHDAEDGDQKGGGLMKKLKAWKQEEHELHLQHRGIMQKKPARTATWLKDNVEDAGHKIKDRFAMKGRQPGVETEV